MITARELRELLDDLQDGVIASSSVDMTPVDDAIADAESYLNDVESALSRARKRMAEIDKEIEVKVDKAFEHSLLIRRLHQLLSDLEHEELHASLNAKEAR